MKNLMSILDKFEHKIEHAEEILVEEHALNIAPSINKMFYDLVKGDKELAVAIEHLHNNKEIREKNSLTELIHISLLPYENRTIHIEKEPDYNNLAEIFSSYRGIDFVAAYKHYFFEPLSVEMWEKHTPKLDTRMVFYAKDMKTKDGKNQVRAIEAIEKTAGMLGSLATTKRKRYNQYAARAYTIAERNGLHSRPAAQLVTIANKYSGDSWIRTDNMEVKAKSIMHVLMLEATANKKLTILYKPKENAEAFYNELESSLIDRVLRKAD